jgi:hypothetical protein
MKKKQPTQKILETDLYKPVHDYLVEQGYTVHSEVKDCDITAVKGQELIVIELKCLFNAKLLMQATRRQLAADSVYVAIPKPKGAYKKDWADMCHLLRRLELGLITVSFNSNQQYAEIIFHPSPYDLKKSKKKKYSILKEIAGRTGNYNTGGSRGKKLMTAYKENAVHIACCFQKFGPLSPKQLRALGTGPKTLSILSKNFYGWFKNISRGLYDLHPECTNCLDNYTELATRYRNIVNDFGSKK